MSQNEKIVKWFYLISVAVMVLGAVMLIADGEYDLYTAWATVTFIAGAYFVNKAK